MAMFELNGAWTALVTPFNEDFSVDWTGFEKNIQFQIEQGITGILPVGTTGESPTLNWEEHDAVIESGVKFAGGRVPVMAGVGSNNTAESVRGAKHAVDNGAAIGLLVDCYYNGPSSLELRTQYYEHIASQVPDFPLLPYIIPGRSGCELSAEDMAILTENPQFVGVKEATGNIERMKRERSLFAVGAAIMSGDDNITASIMADPAIRADGVISVMTNLFPAAIVRMVAHFRAGENEQGVEQARKLGPVFDLVTVKVENPRTVNGQTVTVVDKFRNPIGVKTMMAGLGMPSMPCRRPLGKMTDNAVQRVRGALKTIWDASPELLQPIGDFYGVDVAEKLADDANWSALAVN